MSDRIDEAMAAVPRLDFLPSGQRVLSRLDMPLSIGHGQTNSQPYTVAVMLRLLDVEPGHRVLDVGSGSGWTTALLAWLVGPTGRVLGVERIPALVEHGQKALEPHAQGRAEIRQALPGVLGWPDEGPYDRLLVSAEPATMPQELVDQLAEGGVMVIPVAGRMHRVVRRGDEVDNTTHGDFRFVPLVTEE